MLNGSIELFIHYKTTCVYYINLQNTKSTSCIDVQLVSGFLSTSSLFFDEMGIGKNSPIFRLLRGKSEIRMIVGNKIHGTLLLNNLQFLNENTYTQLDILLKSILKHFEKTYVNELEVLDVAGKLNFDGIDEFIQDKVEKMKAHIFSTYLLQILGTALNRKLFKNRAFELINSFDIVYNSKNIDNKKIKEHNHKVRKEILQYQSTHITLAKIIPHINCMYQEIWEVFQVPTIPKPEILINREKLEVESEETDINSDFIII